jgi:hypothetical protein
LTGKEAENENQFLRDLALSRYEDELWHMLGGVSVLPGAGATAALRSRLDGMERAKSLLSECRAFQEINDGCGQLISQAAGIHHQPFACLGELQQDIYHANFAL